MTNGPAIQGNHVLIQAENGIINIETLTAQAIRLNIGTATGSPKQFLFDASGNLTVPGSVSAAGANLAPVVGVLATVRSVSLAAIGDTQIDLVAPSSGTWGLLGFELYNTSGTLTNHAGSFFTAAAGAGTNLGSCNLATVTAGLSRGLYGLSPKPVAPATIYWRTTTQSAGAATADITVFGIKLP